jgi:hypothetical protein
VAKVIPIEAELFGIRVILKSKKFGFNSNKKL